MQPDELDSSFVAANQRVNAAREELALAEHELRSAIIAAQLPDNPDALLTEEQRAYFAEWAERNRLRKARISRETGIDRVG